MKSLDKFKGCLIGGACGDALGNEIEFLGEKTIFSIYGPSGITEYELENGKARITDDTQMTLFTANALLLGTTCNRMQGINRSYTYYIRECYKDWYRTQTERFSNKNNKPYVTWLFNIPELFASRSPGMTCLSALSAGGKGTIENPINNSKGCGTVMRVAPIGLYFIDNQDYTPEAVMRLGAESAALTHGHELGYIPTATLVHIISCLAQEGEHSILDAVKEAMKKTNDLFKNAKHLNEFEAIMNKAIKLSTSTMSDLDAIHMLGEGWVAESNLAIAVYCALKYPTDIEKALIASVNHQGDSDSTGAVVGNIVGANVGLSNIPQKFLDKLELKDVILEIAEDLYNDCPMKNNRDNTNWSNAWEHKYIKKDYRG